jgi:hypothetical protein
MIDLDNFVLEEIFIEELSCPEILAPNLKLEKVLLVGDNCQLWKEG